MVLVVIILFTYLVIWFHIDWNLSHHLYMHSAHKLFSAHTSCLLWCCSLNHIYLPEAELIKPFTACSLCTFTYVHPSQIGSNNASVFFTPTCNKTSRKVVMYMLLLLKLTVKCRHVPRSNPTCCGSVPFMRELASNIFCWAQMSAMKSCLSSKVGLFKSRSIPKKISDEMESAFVMWEVAHEILLQSCFQHWTIITLSVVASFSWFINVWLHTHWLYIIHAQNQQRNAIVFTL